MRTLPQAPYADAAEAALTEDELKPEQVDAFVEDSYDVPYLRAVITLTPETSGIPAGRYPHGLILIWDWHTGRDEGHERGPVWQWARLNDDGSNRDPEPLTAEGYASPEYVVEGVRALLGHRNQSGPASRWNRASELDAACEAWAKA